MKHDYAKKEFLNEDQNDVICDKFMRIVRTVLGVGAMSALFGWMLFEALVSNW